MAHTNSVENVLQTMGLTVRTRGKQGYRPRASMSCYAQVAQYLVAHSNVSGYILLFGDLAHDVVQHACLYDDSGGALVDTFRGKFNPALNDYPGKPVARGGKLYYTHYDDRTDRVVEYACLRTLRTSTFLAQYVKP